MVGMISLSYLHIHFFIPVKNQGNFWVFLDVINEVWGMYSVTDLTHTAKVLEGTIPIFTC